MRPLPLFFGGLIFGLGAASSSVWAGETLKPTPALVELEQASRGMLSGSMEGLVSQGSSWSDGSSRGRVPLTAARWLSASQDKPSAGPADAGESRPRATVPSAGDGRVRGSQDERYVQFSFGFLEVEKPALDLMMGSWPSKILGALVGAVLFIPAVIWGGLRAFF